MIDPTHANIGIRIREIREKKGISREALAEKAGISAQFLGQMETGKKGFSTEIAAKIITALNASSEYLLFGRNVPVDHLETASQTLAGLSEDELRDTTEIIELVSELLKKYNDAIKDDDNDKK